MRVTLVGPAHPFKGAVVHHTAELAHRLAGKGHQVELVSWSRPYPERLYPGQLTVSEPEVEPFEPTLPRLAWNRPDTWLAAGWRARESDLTVISQVVGFQALPYTAMAALAGRSSKVAVICHNVLPHERRPGDKVLTAMLLNRAGLLLVHSPAEAGRASSLSNTPVAVASLPPHIPREYMPARRPEPGVHRRLLFFGIVRPYKGVDVLLRALAAGPPDVELRIAGEVWGGVDALSSLRDELGLADRVVLRPGHLEAAAVPELFSDVDALVLPYREATGTHLVSIAFQFGVPAIVTRTGELAELIRPGVDGLVAEPGDVESLTAAIDALYTGGAAEALRAEVRPVDPGPAWDAYLDALLG